MIMHWNTNLQDNGRKIKYEVGLNIFFFSHSKIQYQNCGYNQEKGHSPILIPLAGELETKGQDKRDAHALHDQTGPLVPDQPCSETKRRRLIQRTNDIEGLLNLGCALHMR